MDELRALLLQPEHAEIESLKQQLASRPPVDATSVADVLSAAVTIANGRDEALSQALQPQIESGLRNSVRQNPDVITEAIFPIIGGTISRAVRESLTRLLQQTTYAVEHAFSLRAWRWRIEALATGKSFSEVVLLHSLVYRVEQVFLIHPESGLLLHHVIAPQVEEQLGEEAKDVSMVTSMLTAIQDFVRDSFRVESKAALDSIEVGDLKVWLERGPQAVLACVVRGTAPSELRELLRTTVETVQKNCIDILRNFSGDTDELVPARPYLEACLQEQQKPEKKSSHLSLFLLGIAVLATSFVLGRGFLRERQWNQQLQFAVETFKREPGVVLLSASQQRGTFRFQLLRDPDAVTESQLVEKAGLAAKRKQIDFASYLSTEPQMLQQRAIRILRPPDGVSLSFHSQSGQLVATGIAPAQWIDESKLLARLIPGVRQFDCQAKSLPRPKSLYQVLHERALVLESIEFRFRAGSVELLPGQEDQLQRAVGVMKELVQLVENDQTGMNVTIEVHAHTDPIGTELYNLKLRESRAKMMRHWLASAGVDMRRLKPVAPLQFEQEKAERAASFRVVITGGFKDNG